MASTKKSKTAPERRSRDRNWRRDMMARDIFTSLAVNFYDSDERNAFSSTFTQYALEAANEFERARIRSK